MKTKIIQYKTIAFYGLTFLFFLLPFSGIQAQNEIGINTTSPKSDFEVNGSFAKKTVTVTANTTLDATHNIVICNNNATKITITLPAVAGCAGRIYTIKKSDANDSLVTIAPNASETIDGASSLVLSDIQVMAMLISNGAEWKIIGDHPEAFPVGEISFFDIASITFANITAISNGSTNMVICAPVTNFVQRGEFSMPQNGRLQYTGATTKTFHIACTISMRSTAGSNTFVFGLAKNGQVEPASKILNYLTTTSRQSTSLHLMATMSRGDYLELYVGDLTSNVNDATIYSLNIVAIGML